MSGLPGLYIDPDVSDVEVEHDHRQCAAKGSISRNKAVLSAYQIHPNTCYMLFLSTNVWVEKKSMEKYRKQCCVDNENPST